MSAEKWMMVAVGAVVAALTVQAIKDAKAKADAERNRVYWSDANRWE